MQEQGSEGMDYYLTAENDGKQSCWRPQYQPEARDRTIALSIISLPDTGPLNQALSYTYFRASIHYLNDFRVHKRHSQTSTAHMAKTGSVQAEHVSTEP